MTAGVDKVEQAVDAVVDNMATVETRLIVQVLLGLMIMFKFM